MKKSVIQCASICLLSVLGLSRTDACTDFRLTAQDGTVLISRSMEFGTDMKTQLRTSTKGRAYQFQTTDGKPAAQWVAQFGYIYLDALDQDVAVDGMNEAGLSIEGLYLPSVV